MPDIRGDQNAFGRQMAFSDMPVGGQPAFAPIVAPALAAGGFISVQTAAAGAEFVPCPTQACRQLTLANDTGTKLEVRQGGSGATFPLEDKAIITLYGLSNADQIEVRRADVSNTRVTLKARWEA